MPKLIIVSANYPYAISGSFVHWFFWIQGISSERMNGGDGYGDGFFLLNAKTLNWYYPYSAANQFNAANTTYGYVAIG